MDRCISTLRNSAQYYKHFLQLQPRYHLIESISIRPWTANASVYI